MNVAMGGIPHAGLYEPPATVPLQMVTNAHMSLLFHAAAEATEEAILNALLAAGDLMGRDGLTSYGSDSIRSMGGFGKDLGWNVQWLRTARCLLILELHRMLALPNLACSLISSCCIHRQFLGDSSLPCLKGYYSQFCYFLDST